MGKDFGGCRVGMGSLRLSLWVRVLLLIVGFEFFSVVFRFLGG